MNAVEIDALGDNAPEIASWDNYVSAHPAGTIYHLSAWRAIFEQSFGYRSWLLVARDAASREVRGVLPLYLVPTPFARRLVSVPFRDRGGILWDTPEAFEALLQAAHRVADETGAPSVRLKSLVEYPAQQASALGLTESRYWIHSVVTLQQLTVTALWKAIGDKNRNMVRQAQRHGLACSQLEVTPDDLVRWHILHVATQKRLGIPPFPRAFFSTMSARLHPDSRLALFGVKRENDLRAAAIVLLHRDTAIYAYSASSTERQHEGANDLLLFEVMRWLIERGFAVFDLGSDSPKQDSLLFFKRKWLAEQASIPHYFFGKNSHIDSSEKRYDLARKCFRLLPTPVLASVGAAITRYFG